MYLLFEYFFNSQVDYIFIAKLLKQLTLMSARFGLKAVVSKTHNANDEQGRIKGETVKRKKAFNAIVIDGKMPRLQASAQSFCSAPIV